MNPPYTVAELREDAVKAQAEYDYRKYIFDQAVSAINPKNARSFVAVQNALTSLRTASHYLRLHSIP